MKRIIIYTDGATLDAVCLPDDGCEEGRFAGESPHWDAVKGAGEQIHFVGLNGCANGQTSSIRELACGIGEIVREEHVDLWHLVAPPDVKERLAPILDEPVQLRLSPIGFGDLVEVAESCESAVSGSSSWEATEVWNHAAHNLN